MKRRVLCYGDSNTWGYVPRSDDRQERFGPDLRWTGRLKHLSDWDVLEEGLNSRTTGLDDPDLAGKNGAQTLRPTLVRSGKLDAVILMLGTNDLKRKFMSSAREITERMRALIHIIRDNSQAQILLLAPAPPQLAHAYEDYQYPEIETKARELASLYSALAREEGTLFLDASQLVEASKVDGVHLDAESHRVFAERIYETLKPVLD